MDLRSLQLAMGHESLETTSLYLSDVSHYLQRHRRPISVADAAHVIAGIDRAGDDRVLPVPGFAH